MCSLHCNRGANFGKAVEVQEVITPQLTQQHYSSNLFCVVAVETLPFLLWRKPWLFMLDELCCERWSFFFFWTYFLILNSLYS